MKTKTFQLQKQNLRSFQIRFNLRSFVMNVQMIGFGFIDCELCFFYLKL